MKNFNKSVFLTSFILIGLFIFASCIVLIFNEHNDSFFLDALRYVDIVILFPTFMIIAKNFPQMRDWDNDWIIILISFCVNGSLYALLIERIINFRKKKIANPH
jgi:hypothetical protein